MRYLGGVAVRLDDLHDRGAIVERDGLSLDQAVALDDAEQQDLAGRPPSGLALAMASERGFIALQRSVDGRLASRAKR